MESREDVEKPCSFPCRGRRSILLSAWKSERVCLALRIHLSRRQIVNPFFFSVATVSLRTLANDIRSNRIYM